MGYVFGNGLFDQAFCLLLSYRYISTLLQRLQNKRAESTASSSLLIYPPSLETSTGPQTTRYIGPSSCLSKCLSLIKDPRTGESRVAPPPRLPNTSDPHFTLEREHHDYLVQKYMSEIHILYPIVDETSSFLLPGCLSEEDHTKELNPRERFILNMVYLLASHRVLDESKGPEEIYSYRRLGDHCHREVYGLFDKAAADITMGTLQAVTLAALHSMITPKEWSIGQLIGLAARLVIDLGSGDQPRGDPSEEDQRQRIYKSIYCLENQYATTLDRPRLLPEPDIPQEPGNPQDLLCAFYRIQSRFRSEKNDVRPASLLQELDNYAPVIDRMPIQSRCNLHAVLNETRLLLQPEDEEIATCLLEVYARGSYNRTSLSPPWAHRAGMVIVSGVLRWNKRLDSGKGSSREVGESFQAYGTCLLFLEQCSLRWPGARALRTSLLDAMAQTRKE